MAISSSDESDIGCGVMLDTFVVQHREEIIHRCRVKARLRAIPQSIGDAGPEMSHFLDQLVDILRHRRSSGPEMDQTAAHHGHDLLLQGYTVSDVVHSYGDVGQAITDLALHLDVPIPVGDFRTLNRCLDDAIASAVTEYGRDNQSRVDAETARGNERVGLLAHEIRNLVGRYAAAPPPIAS